MPCYAILTVNNEEIGMADFIVHRIGRNALIISRIILLNWVESDCLVVRREDSSVVPMQPLTVLIPENIHVNRSICHITCQLN